MLATKSPKASSLEGDVAIALSKALQTDRITEQSTKKLSKVRTVKRNYCYKLEQIAMCALVSHGIGTRMLRCR